METMDAQQFCLKWDGFQGSVTSLFDQLRQDGELVDVTLCCEGQRVRAHRMMLSACSPYFRQLIQENPCQQMVFFLKDTSAADLSAIIEFIYKGSVNVAQSQLANFIKTAEMLQIRGLSGDDDKPPTPVQPTTARSPAAKRRRLSEHEPPPPPPPPAAPAPAPSPGGSRPPGSPGVPASSDHSAAPSPPSAAAPPLQTPHPPPPPPPAGSTAPHAGEPQPAAGGAVDPAERLVKVEKLDPEDNALEYMTDYESGYSAPAPPLDTVTMEQMANALLPAPGPSQRLTEDGNAQARFVCDLCGRRYKYRTSLHDHQQHHEGRTVCSLCGSVASTVYNLRLHLRNVHQLASDQVRAMTGYGARRGPALQPPGQMAALASSREAAPPSAHEVASLLFREETPLPAREALPSGHNQAPSSQ